MPCQSDYDEGTTVSIDYVKSCHIATQLACRYCQQLEKANRGIPSWAARWWEEHKRADVRRREEEKEEIVRKKCAAVGLAKLTSEERKALGLGA